jgi:signal transduction histidine kinase
VIKDLVTQANIIAEISAPAIEFNDPIIAKENLMLLRTRPLILRAAVFTPNNRFADYVISTEQPTNWPARPQLVNNFVINDDQIEVWQKIIRNGETLGVVYINARYEAHKRLIDYIILLVCVMGACLGLALLIAIWLRGAVTKPIFAVTSVARHVMKTRDFSLRAEKFTEDEIGVLADAFNDMLSEVERRASALEQSNQSLEREMSERHSAEVALRIADQRKDEFLATLAHELRNPLAPISNGLHILRLAKDKPDIAENAQAVMERQLAQMVRLVDDLLDVSRINTGKLSINKTHVDIQSVMRDALESSGPFIESCGHKLSINMPVEPVYLDADPIRLAQVFSNILNNAAKYTNRGGIITIDATIEESSKPEENKIFINITDSGIGIEPNMLKDIFNMFTQVNQSLERTHAGLGVGLALVKRLVELHGYELYATSKGLGFGSTFSLRLNIIEKAQANKNETTESNKADIKNRIMLIDDNVDFVTTMATLLETKGHDVRIAHDGFAAQKIARTFLPQIAFLDIGMPGMNGYDLARHLRQMPETATTILVAITGWGQEKDRQLSRDAGFNYHLVKPVDLTQVLKLIEG